MMTPSPVIHPSLIHASLKDDEMNDGTGTGTGGRATAWRERG
jgi:hypothetical protein